MTFPTVKSRTSGNAARNSGSFVVPIPGSAVAGNMFLIAKSSRFATDDIWPGGWTDLCGGSTNFNIVTYTRYKLLDAGDITTGSITITQTSGETGWVAYLIGGAKSAEGAAYIGSWDPPNLTPSWGALDTLWIATVANYGNWSNAYPSGYSNGLMDGQNESYQWAAEKQLNAASEDPPAYSNIAGGTPVAGTVAIQPSFPRAFSLGIIG